jgi:beta-phosphoglucomutase-like phosphatase (HAD superfamily)
MAKEYLSKQQYQQWRYPTTEDFASLQANLRLVLWDFDIPITHLFSGLSAYTVTQYLRDYLWEKGLAKEEDLIDTDPHTIYRRGKRFADNDIESYFELERLLTEKECEAAKLADPTPNAIELIRALDANGIQQAIVTNNSPKAATIYLQKQKLEHIFKDYIFGRDIT